MMGSGIVPQKYRCSSLGPNFATQNTAPSHHQASDFTFQQSVMQHSQHQPPVQQHARQQSSSSQKRISNPLDPPNFVQKFEMRPHLQLYPCQEPQSPTWHRDSVEDGEQQKMTAYILQ